MISNEGSWAINIDISLTAYIYNINIAKSIFIRDHNSFFYFPTIKQTVKMPSPINIFSQADNPL